MKPGTKEHTEAIEFAVRYAGYATGNACEGYGLGRDTAIRAAVLVKTLAVTIAEMVCEDKENVQKIMRVEEDYDLFEATKEKVVTEVYAACMDVAIKEAERLAAAAEVYGG